MNWLVCGLLLSAPVFYVALVSSEQTNPGLIALSAFGIAGIYALLAQAAFKWSRIAGLAVVAVFIGALSVRLVYALLIHFSGNGFTDEVFFHIEPTSFRIAWQQYGPAFIVALLCAVLLMALIGRLARPVRIRGYALIASISVLAGLSWFSRAASPEYLMLAGYRHYQLLSQPVSFDKKTLETLASIPSFAPLKVHKWGVEAEAPNARNLILVYLESFNYGLTRHPDYPGLTPNLNRLMGQHRSLHPNYSSSYVTIEGIVNSQCGTITTMNRGNNSFMGERGALPMWPCLGDVLGRAGYRQIYLGGAVTAFAGKGEFLKSHGYHDVYGWEYWEQQGHKLIGDSWGLPDSELFDQAVRTIAQLRQRPPYNLTLLTLGTHIPGYQYRGCSDYAPNADRFVNAIHCTDYLVGKFVDDLTGRGLLDDRTLLVITGDHGIFPTPDMKRLFGDLVDDRRLLTVVIGKPFEKNLPAADSIPMASYDLTPTLLDLLGVEHNASFAFGRSILSSEHDPGYMTTRFGDYQDGKYIKNNSTICTDATAATDLEPPFSACDKRRLLNALASYQYTLNRPESRSAELCNHRQLIDIEISDTAEAPISVRYHGKDLSGSFAHEGYYQKNLKHGAYLLLASSRSVLAEQLYFRLENAAERENLLNILNAAAGTQLTALAVKTDSPDDIPVPVREYFADAGLPLRDSTQSLALIALGSISKKTALLKQVDARRALSVRLNPDQCNDWLAMLDQN